MWSVLPGHHKAAVTTLTSTGFPVTTKVLCGSDSEALGTENIPTRGLFNKWKGDELKSKGGSRAEEMPEGHSWVRQESNL